MNQQQLQIARSALWHQTAARDPAAALLTFDDAARWLDETGLCLFLPRHTQLPAPAPSFVEACMGASSVTPPAAAIAQATELASRLIDERRAIPLNLLGTSSDQPDFLIPLEVLPWVAAIRGDRQWKSAPGGRAAPIVIRAWEALDREGEKTAIEIREILGRELTEAAVVRALIELWTTLRATPIYATAQPTRWTLLKNRYPAQLATAANTAQTTALSALLSLYLQSVVAATAEETEVFLSPLTSRSRIREVLHGMVAARQLGTMSVASRTLLFVEGSLPEVAGTAEPENGLRQPESAAPEPLAPAAHRPFRKEPRPTRWEVPPRDSREQHASERPPWQKKPAAAYRSNPSSDRPPRDGKRFTGRQPASGSRSNRAEVKPWQRRSVEPLRGREVRKGEGGAPSERAGVQKPPPRDGRPRSDGRPRNYANGRPEDRWRSRGRSRPGEPGRRDDRPAARGSRSGKSGSSGTGAPRSNKRFVAKGRFSGSGKFSPAKPQSRGPSRPFRDGNTFSGKSDRPAMRGLQSARSGKAKNKFRNSAPGKRNPRKNHSQEERPE